MYKKILLFLWFFSIILTTSYILLREPHYALALKMSNSSYIINMGNLNSFAGNKSNSSYKLSDTGGQLGPGLYSGSNYKVRAGFQYVRDITQFAFAISSTVIDFGTLTANNPITRTNILTVSNGSAHGYQVTAMENAQLIVPASGALIPNTTCDNGLCTPTTSDTWTSTSTYGFGYRCDDVSGTNCTSGFSSSNNYKQFSASPSASVVLSGNTGRNLQSTITYKVNISTTQPPGLYTNQIMYIATPTF